MARVRRRRSFRGNGGGGTGGGKSGGMGSWGGQILIVFGCVALVVTLIMFGIALSQLDTSLTAVTAYDGGMVGLEEIMGVSGLIIWLAFGALGIGAIAGGAYVNIKNRYGGNWMDLVMLTVFGGITLVIALIMFGIAVTQLQANLVAINATANTFTGLYSVARTWGLLIFLSVLAAGLAQVTAAGIGAYKYIRA